MKRLLGIALAVVLTLLLTQPTSAAGPDDGIYSFVASYPGAPTVSAYISVHQNGSTVVFVVLNLNGVWDFGVGTRSGNAVSGTLYLFTGAPYGTFNVTLAGSAVSGQAILGGYPYSVLGARLF